MSVFKKMFVGLTFSSVLTLSQPVSAQGMGGSIPIECFLGMGSGFIEGAVESALGFNPFSAFFGLILEEGIRKRALRAVPGCSEECNATAYIGSWIGYLSTWALLPRGHY